MRVRCGKNYFALHAPASSRFQRPLKIYLFLFPEWYLLSQMHLGFGLTITNIGTVPATRVPAIKYSGPSSNPGRCRRGFWFHLFLVSNSHLLFIPACPIFQRHDIYGVLSFFYAFFRTTPTHHTSYASTMRQNSIQRRYFGYTRSSKLLLHQQKNGNLHSTQ